MSGTSSVVSESNANSWAVLGELVIHYALKCNKNPDCKEYPVLEYLTRECPAALEKKSSGRTPLLAACDQGYTDNVEILIKADANLFARDYDGSNMIHLTLHLNRNADQARRVLALIEPKIRDQLFQQRKNLTEGGTTPIHSWVSYFSSSSSHYNKTSDAIDILRLLLDYTEGEGLELLNGAGDTCLHTAIMNRQIGLARVLINYNPKLLFRENAVGRTPAEIAKDSLTAMQFTKPEDPDASGSRYTSLSNAIWQIERETKYHAERTKLSDSEKKEKLTEIGLTGDYEADDVVDIAGAAGIGGYNREFQAIAQKVMERVVCDLCATAAEKHQQPRRLVSLNEANDVARRLGEQYSDDRYCSDEPDATE